MVSWGMIQTALVVLGPMVVPRVLAFYRSIRSGPVPGTGPVPITARAAFVLKLLLIFALLALLSTIPYFAPSNIFVQTSSRLQTPNNVLFARLSKLGPLSPQGRRLRKLFDKGGLEARLLYLRFGPDVLASCPFVSDPADPSAAWSYLLYALPIIVAPHVAHLTVLGLATSNTLAGRAGARFRLLALIAGIGLGGLDVGATCAFDHQSNAKAERASDLDHFFWTQRLVRGLVIAVVDAVLGWVVWLAATKRAFVALPSSAEKIEASTNRLELLLIKMRGLGTVRNVVMRDRGMRGEMERYWVNENQLMGTIMEDRGVVSAMTDVLANTNVSEMQRDAKTYVDMILPLPS